MVDDIYEDRGQITYKEEHRPGESSFSNANGINEVRISETNPYNYNWTKSISSEQDQRLSAAADDDDYWDAMESIEAENSGSHPFSLERELYHETRHGTQPETNEYLFNRAKYEDPVIEETNSFMGKYYGEPYRGSHSDLTFVGQQDRLNYSCP